MFSYDSADNNNDHEFFDNDEVDDIDVNYDDFFDADDADSEPWCCD